ncbi:MULTISPECIES: DNA-binding protein [unclassified Burkholderia]|uniref:DNA-binding protein n=1 Tax=unclassified Burkholderia TaxID=2613784 RepID=UPI0007B9C3B9|nr:MULTISPECIES: DNA-binding protein [unclassified Burkholderia]
MTVKLKTREEVLADFSRKGVSVSSWAKRHGLNPAVVHAVLKGTRQARIGQSHKAAVLLGLKEGEIADDVCDTFDSKGVAPSRSLAERRDTHKTHDE